MLAKKPIATMFVKIECGRCFSDFKKVVDADWSTHGFSCPTCGTIYEVKMRCPTVEEAIAHQG